MTGHERRDLDARRVLLTGGGILGLIAVALVISALALSAWRLLSPSPGAAPETFTEPGALPPQPALQSDPHSDLLRLRAVEDSVLTRYAWVERDSGIVRIPVARGMDILVKKGLPTRKTNPSTEGKP